ncbi:hypothetical protein [Paenibacillus sp. FSL R5-0519]|uniref:hypothetical protein n=1 Tax=Paenibacillus sp. FSL R5-0519 TaxID=2921648 RepID=UPI0030D82622
MGTLSENVNKDRDGGYYAVKGFLYQFDMTIKTILLNPSQDVLFEQLQDISYENFIIQVKHKESQTYAHSKIRKPIVQLLDLHKEDESKKYRLHCYFKNTVSHKKNLSIKELNDILSVEKSNYTAQQKAKFLKCFELYYTEDFITQFDEVISLIESSYSLKDRQEAILHHAMIRSHLLQLSINKDKLQRMINKSNLDSYVIKARKLFFDSGYASYLGREKYERYLKKMYFTVDLNLLNLERLFIVDVYEDLHFSIIAKIMSKIIRKYKRLSKSPPPIFYLRKLSRERTNHFKQLVYDNGDKFNDGTFFDGDRFRIEKFKDDNDCLFKIINEKNLEEVLSANYINEIYHFYLSDYLEIDGAKDRITNIHLEDISQILNII